MPEYLAPGVYVEEVSFRARAINGVDTTTAGFIGPCRYGPVAGTPVLLVMRHRENIRKIFNGTESRIGQKKPPADAG